MSQPLAAELAVISHEFFQASGECLVPHSRPVGVVSLLEHSFSAATTPLMVLFLDFSPGFDMQKIQYHVLIVSCKKWGSILSAGKEFQN